MVKLQDQLSEQKSKELSSLKERLLSEKREAVARTEHRTTEQVAKLQQQLQKVKEQNREEKATFEKQMTRQLVSGKISCSVIGRNHTEGRL